MRGSRSAPQTKLREALVKGCLIKETKPLLFPQSLVLKYLRASSPTILVLKVSFETSPEK